MSRAESGIADVAYRAVLQTCGFKADLAIRQVHVTYQAAAGTCPAFWQFDRASRTSSPGTLSRVRAPLDITIVLPAAVD